MLRFEIEEQDLTSWMKQSPESKQSFERQKDSLNYRLI